MEHEIKMIMLFHYQNLFNNFINLIIFLLWNFNLVRVKMIKVMFENSFKSI